MGLESKGSFPFGGKFGLFFRGKLAVRFRECHKTPLHRFLCTTFQSSNLDDSLNASQPSTEEIEQREPNPVDIPLLVKNGIRLFHGL